MSGQTRQRALDGALESAVRELAGAERYRRHHTGTRTGRARAADGAHPLEFDDTGFPVPQCSPSFVERVGRLLNPA